MHYIYCPLCASKLVDKEAGDDGLVPFCESCSKYWFDSFSSCVIILVTNEYNEIAFLKQNYLSDKYWTFVAGYIKPGESAEETALREVEEEIGIKLDRLEYEGTHWFDLRNQLMHSFIGYAKKDNLVLSKEVDDALWVNVSDAENYLFPDSPGNAQYILYKKYLSKLNNAC